MTKVKASRHTALLVEDDLETAGDLRDLLKSLGHDCVHVTNQADGMAVFERGVDICYVLLDVQILVEPDSTNPKVEGGLNLLRFIRERFPERNPEDQHRLQVLVMSGFAKDTPSVVEALQLGGDDFSVKPFSQNKVPLAQKIREALGKSGRGRHEDCRTPLVSRSVTKRSEESADEPSEEPGCWVLETGKKERRVRTEAERKALQARAHRCHLFLDLTDMVSQRTVRAGFIGADGKFHPKKMPLKRAIAVAEVMTAPGGLRGKEFYVESTRVSKTFIEGRQLIDLKLPSGQWRSLKTLMGDHPSQTRFIFRPEPGIRYLLLHDLPEERKKKPARKRG